MDEKENRLGKFETFADLIDSRKDELKDTKLVSGFGIACGNKGNKLSGGQKQRIAIARAVVRKPSILLLDEATSALDESNQRKVLDALDNIMVNRTSIVVAHRLTTVEKCNRVAVIDDGKVVEEGTYASLRDREGGYFANIANGMATNNKPAQKTTTEITN